MCIKFSYINKKETHGDTLQVSIFDRKIRVKNHSMISDIFSRVKPHVNYSMLCAVSIGNCLLYTELAIIASLILISFLYLRNLCVPREDGFVFFISVCIVLRLTLNVMASSGMKQGMSFQILLPGT